MISIILAIMQKKKADKYNDSVGKRYWGDAITCLACYSTRTATMWAGRVYGSSEISCLYAHMPYAQHIGERYDIGHNILTNSYMTTAFNVPYRPGIDWESQSVIMARLNPIMHFTRGSGHNPAYPCHAFGMFMDCANQAYMGLSTAAYPTTNVIVNSIPGTVYTLMDQGPDYSDMSLWVRNRSTIDVGHTVGINPVAIVLDLLLDQNYNADIDWLNFAEVGKKYIKEKPYMWFSMQIGEMSLKNAIKDVLQKANLAIKTQSDGRIGIKMVGTTQAASAASIVMLDVMTEVNSFSLSKASVEESDVLNMISANYNAARADTSAISTAEWEETILPPQYVDAFREWEAANATALVGKTFYERVELFPGYDSESDAAHAGNNAAIVGQNEWHYKTADAYVINAANIVTTGIRRRDNLDLSFLSWPDDVSSYLQDTLNKNDRPYLEGEITASMRMYDLSVGDTIRLVIPDKDSVITLDRVFDIEELEIDNYPEETITFTLKENAQWYNVLTPLPGQAGGTDPNEWYVSPPNGSYTNDDDDIILPDGTVLHPDHSVTYPVGSVTNPDGSITTPGKYTVWPDNTVYDPEGKVVQSPPRGEETDTPPPPDVEQPPERPVQPRIFSLQMIAVANSPFVTGAPCEHFLVNYGTNLLQAAKVYVVESCDATADRSEDNMLANMGDGPAFLFTLDEDVLIPDQAEGFLKGITLEGTYWMPELGNVEQVIALINDNVSSIGSTGGFLFDKNYVAEGHLMLTTCSKNEPGGVGLVMRFQSYQVYELDGAIKCTIKGLYLEDYGKGLAFRAGQMFALMSDVSHLQTYGASQFPVPRGYALTEQSVDNDYFFRTMVASAAEEIPWPRAYCSQYHVYSTWNETLKFDTFIHNESSTYKMYGEDETCIAHSAADVMRVWFSAHDFRTTTARPDMAEADIPASGAGIDLLTRVSQLRCVKHGEGSASGITGLRATITFYRNGQRLNALNVYGGNISVSFRMGDICGVYRSGETINTKVTVYYDIVNSMLELPTRSRTTEMDGPDIYCA